MQDEGNAGQRRRIERAGNHRRAILKAQNREPIAPSEVPRRIDARLSTAQSLADPAIRLELVDARAPTDRSSPVPVASPLRARPFILNPLQPKSATQTNVLGSRANARCASESSLLSENRERPAPADWSPTEIPRYAPYLFGRVARNNQKQRKGLLHHYHHPSLRPVSTSAHHSTTITHEVCKWSANVLRPDLIPIRVKMTVIDKKTTIEGSIRISESCPDIKVVDTKRWVMQLTNNSIHTLNLSPARITAFWEYAMKQNFSARSPHSEFIHDQTNTIRNVSLRLREVIGANHEDDHLRSEAGGKFSILHAPEHMFCAVATDAEAGCVVFAKLCRKDILAH
jgi:hypothetical protein